MTLAGHSPAHLPQPTHRSRSTRADILRTDVLHAFQDCSPEHLLGTDNLGRDVYSLLAEGAFRTLTVVGLASSLSLTAGTLLGMTAACSGRTVRGLIQLFADLTLIVPSFISALILSALFGFGPVGAGLVFGIGNIGGYVHQAQSLTQRLKTRGFLEAETVLGAGTARVIFAHILPNICRQLLIYLGNKASSVTLQYAGLAFIGLGTDVTSPDWGTLLYQYRSYLFTCPRLVLCPAAAICLLALWFHVLFDSRAQKDEGTIYD